MKILVNVLKYEIIFKNDQPELAVTETNEIISFDFPVNRDGDLDLTVIPEEKVSFEYKVDGILIPCTLTAPKFSIIWYF